MDNEPMVDGDYLSIWPADVRAGDLVRGVHEAERVSVSKRSGWVTVTVAGGGTLTLDGDVAVLVRR